MSERQVRCTKCGHVGPYAEYPKGRDFFQKEFIRACPKEGCDNSQTPGDASMRMAPGRKTPFEWVDPAPEGETPLEETLRRAEDPS